MEVPLYPLLFTSIREEPGVADLLSAYLGATERVDVEGNQVCWQLVDSDGRRSVVKNGPFAGESMGDLVRKHAAEIVGRRHGAGEAFPLCFRIAESTAQGPLCVYPEGARSVAGGKCRRNQQFWYSLASTSEAEVAVGILPAATRLHISRRVNTLALRELLSIFHPVQGDAFFVPSGCLHAAGPGNLLWQVMEHPGAPLRFSGWGPADAVPAEETAAAASAVNFPDRQLKRIAREARPSARTRKIPLLRMCPQFVVEQLRICDHFVDRTDGSSFHVLTVMDGSVCIDSPVGDGRLKRGELVCVPAAFGEYGLHTDGSPAHVLRVLKRG